MPPTRNTRQRTLIRSVFEDSGRPLAALDVVKLAKARMGSLGVATVYRAINMLVEEGWLVPVEIPAQPTRYEVAGLRHHHHFYCRKCRKVYDVEGCPSEFDDLTPRGFELEAHEIILYGLCLACIPAA